MAKYFSMSLDDELHRQFKTYAASIGRDMADLIREYIEKALKSEQK